jgi:lipopolysaccharide export system protein LptA
MRCWPKSIILAALLLLSFATGLTQEVKIIQYIAEDLFKLATDPPGVIRLRDSVWMFHKNLQLTCDSAYYDKPNSHFIGYGRVHIIKADTLHMYSDQIDYNGKTELARLEGHVFMDNVKETVRAPRIDYDMKEEVAWYYGGGQIIDSANTVESFWGYYYVNQNRFFFKEDVTLTNPDNTLITDSLTYDSKAETMWFEGTTNVFSDTNYIACDRGYYDSKNRISVFNKNVFMQAKEQLLRADSLIYNQADSLTEAFGQVELRDTIENMIVTGEHLFYNESENSFRITENVLYIMVDQADSLFLFSDTLISSREEVKKSRRIRAFPHVQFYRSDIQGRCDSLDYMVADSLIRLFRDPVIWQDKSQMTGDTVAVYLTEGGIEKMELQNQGFLITQEDSVTYNQIKGKSITGYFADDQLHRVAVTGNGECLFYPKDGEQIIGHQKTLCSNINMYFKEKKIDKISFLADPDNKLTPMKDLKPEDLYLEGFEWLGEKRPANREAIRDWK